MHIILVGLNHETTPVDIREKLAFQTKCFGDALEQLTQSKNDKNSVLLEAFIISTCNRVEIYGLAEDVDSGTEFIKEFLSEYSNLPLDLFESFLYMASDLEAVEHLYSVSSGINSMILGETQIQCQVKQAFEEAQRHNSVGPFFSTLCRTALSVGKRVRSETNISRHSLSISHAAVNLVQKSFPDLSKLNILIVGIGKMSLIAIKALVKCGVKNLSIVNRTEQNTEEIAKELNVKTFGFDRLEECMMDADVVICSTAAPHVIISYETVERISKKRGIQPLLLIDIAVPRDVDSEVSNLENVYLYNIDQLETSVEFNREQRNNEVNKVKTIIEQEVLNFSAWYQSLEVKPVIMQLRKQAEEIREKELSRALRRFRSDLNQHDEQIVQDLTRRIINKVLHQPLVRLRQEAEDGNSQRYSAAVRKLFGLEVPAEESLAG